MIVQQRRKASTMILSSMIRFLHTAVAVLYPSAASAFMVASPLVPMTLSAHSVDGLQMRRNNKRLLPPLTKSRTKRFMSDATVSTPGDSAEVTKGFLGKVRFLFCNGKRYCVGAVTHSVLLLFADQIWYSASQRTQEVDSTGDNVLLYPL